MSLEGESSGDLGVDVMLGNAGADLLASDDTAPNDRIRGGSDDDTCESDAGDDVAGCELP